MKAFLFAGGSAVCALGCLSGAIVGAVMLLIDWRSGLAVLGVALVLGAAAKAFDRQKMRAIYGRQLGDLLHEADAEEQTPFDLAERDFLAYARGGKVEPASRVRERAEPVRV